MRRDTKLFTVRNKMIFFSGAIVFFSLLLSGIFFFTTYYAALRNYANENLNASINQTEHLMSNSFEQINNLAFAFLATRHIRSWTNNNINFNVETVDDYKFIAEMQQDLQFALMFDNAWSTKLVNTAYMFADGQCIHLMSRRSENIELIKRQNTLVYERAAAVPEMTVFIPPTEHDANAYMVKKISNINYTKQLLLVFTLNSEAFLNNFSGLTGGVTACLADNEGNIYFTNDSALEKKSVLELNKNIKIKDGETAFEGDSALVVWRSLEKIKFNIIISAPRDIVTRDIMRSMIRYVTIMVCIIFSFTLFALFISTVYTRFIKDLIISLNGIERNDYDTHMPHYKDNDLNMISEAFNRMTHQIKTLINSVYKYEILLKEADIKLLQSQMNPHFLINTLVTISTNALLNNDTKTYSMVSALSKILNAGLDNTRKLNTFIKVKDELEYIKLYLYIQQVRFQDKLHYDIEVDDERILDAYIPRLSVEPIVENAIVHGVEDNTDRGEVLIRMRRINEDLEFTVIDNGKGFNVNTVFENGNAEKNNGHNIGIVNTKKRLELMFGNGYGLEFDSKIGNGTKVIIKMPIIWNLEDSECKGADLHNQSTDC